jgi:hypothetical protein
MNLNNILNKIKKTINDEKSDNFYKTGKLSSSLIAHSIAKCSHSNEIELHFGYFSIFVNNISYNYEYDDFGSFSRCKIIATGRHTNILDISSHIGEFCDIAIRKHNTILKNAAIISYFDKSCFDQSFLGEFEIELFAEEIIQL